MHWIPGIRDDGAPSYFSQFSGITAHEPLLGWIGFLEVFPLVFIQILDFIGVLSFAFSVRFAFAFRPPGHAALRIRNVIRGTVPPHMSRCSTIPTGGLGFALPF